MPFKPVDYAIEISIGPLIDDTDFKSLETSIAYNESGMSVDLFIETTAGITKTDITPTSGGAYAWVHKGNGTYRLVIPASDNDTCGVLWIVGVCDGVLPFESPRYTIVPANVYDGLVAGTDKLKVHTDEITDGLIDDETRLHSGTAQAGGASTITLAAGAIATDDYYKHSIVAITGGTGAGQAGVISTYLGSTRVATMTAAWATQPDNTSTYVILPLGTLPLDSDGINAACDAAIETYRLDELMTAALGSQPVAGSLLGDLTEDDGGTQRFSANALEQGPAGDGETQLHSGTAQAGGASTITLAASAVAVYDYYKHAIVAITAGTGVGQARVISTYVGSTRVATVTTAWATQPDNTSAYVVLPLGLFPLDPTAVNAACDQAIETYRLHELMTIALGSQPAAGSLLGDLTEDDSGTQRFSANALEQGPAGDGETQLHSGTAQAGGASTITLAVGAIATDDYYKHSIVAITGGTGAGQAGVISTYFGSTRVATMTAAWATQPDNTSTYVILPLGTLPLDSDGINAACDAAIETYRLDELMTAALSSQPAAGSLLGDLTEDDGGTQRFSANALEEAPISAGETQLHSGIAASGGASTITLSGSAIATNDYYKHTILAIMQGTGAGQAQIISSYVGSTRVATMAADWAIQPDATSQYVILPFGTVAKVILSDATEADIDAIKDKTDQLNFTGTDVKATLDGEGVDVAKIDGSDIAVGKMKTAAQTIVTGQAVAGTLSTTQMTTDLTEVTDDHYNGRQLIFTSGALTDQATEITDYDGSAKKLTFTTVTEAPQVGDAFTIV